MSDKVKSTFTGHLGMADGPTQFVTAGDVLDAADPVVAQHPALFEAVASVPGETGPEPVEVPASTTVVAKKIAAKKAKNG